MGFDRLGIEAPFSSMAAKPLVGRTVLQIIPDLDAGGAERTTIDIAEALAKAGARALVASRRGRLVSELQAKGGVWIEFPAATKNPLSMMLNISRLARLIKQEHVDLIHARSRAPAWVALGASRIAKIPLVTTFHGAYSGKSPFKLRYNSVMARGKAVIANSHFTAERIVRLYPFARTHLHVIYRGTDFKRFVPQAVDSTRVRALRAQWGVASHERVVLMAARITGWKGQKILIQAARQVFARGLTDTRFVMVGDDQGRSSQVREIDEAIASAGLEGLVIRAAHCTDMPAAYLAAAVVAIPSSEPEAFGRIAVEAQAMGVPVVSTDLGAAPETILAPPAVPENRRTGWLVPPNDENALAEALMQMLTMGASARDILAQRARLHVEQYFSLESMCAATLDVYKRLLA